MQTHLVWYTKLSAFKHSLLWYVRRTKYASVRTIHVVILIIFIDQACQISTQQCIDLYIYYSLIVFILSLGCIPR